MSHTFRNEGRTLCGSCGRPEDDPCHAANSTVAPSELSEERQGVECKLTAEEKQLFQAVLRVIDDGEYRLYEWSYSDDEAAELRKKGSSDQVAANAQRLEFADAIIDTFRRFKGEGK